MFIGSPAWIGLLVIGTLAVALCRYAGELHPGRRRSCAVHVYASDVVRAQDRERHRRLVARRASPWLSAAPVFVVERGIETVFFDPALPDHVVRSHDLPRRAAVRPRVRLDRAGARRPCGAVHAGAAQLWPHTLLGFAALGAACAHAAGGYPLCAVSRRRAGCVDSACGVHRVARARQLFCRGSASAGCPRRPRRRPRCWPLALPAIDWRAVAAAKFGLSGAGSLADRARRYPLALHLLRRQRARGGHGSALWPASCGAAILSSISAPMSATASPRFAGSARGSSRSSRSRPWSRTLKLLYGRDARCRDRARWRSAATPARPRLMINADNPTVSTASTDS